VKSIVSGVPNRVFLGRSRVLQKDPKKSAVKCQPTVETRDRPLCTIPQRIGQFQPEYLRKIQQMTPKTDKCEIFSKTRPLPLYL
jgi:hypothetical protein